MLFSKPMVGRDGHFLSAIDLDCVDDGAAVDYAKEYGDGHDVEVWHGGDESPN